MNSSLPAGYRIRNMQAEDLATAVEWAAREGWNPGLADAPAFFAADPRGFFIGELDGKPVGTISGVAYDHSFGFFGLYIVDPAYRGQGLGMALTRRMLDYLGTRVIGLDGVVAQQDNYRRIGAQTAFVSLRCQGRGGGGRPEGLTDLTNLEPAQMEALVEVYDARCFPAPRAAFLRAWVNYPGGTALGVVHEGSLRGYGVIRPCRQGWKIGPLFADDPADADLLYRGLAAAAPDDALFLDVPQNNPAAMELANRYGLEPVFETARMYINGRPRWAGHLVYGITTFELG